MKTLFRYSPHNTDYKDEVITHSRLWFSKPDDFNDPLDSRLDYRQEYSTEEIDSFWRGFLKSKPDHPQSLDEVLQRWGSNKDFVEQQNRVFNQFRSQMGVACFSETPTNILMWSHYANNHKGIVYEFKPDLFLDSVHSTAFVHEKAVLETGVFIDENAWIGAGAVVKKGTVIGKGSIVRENTVIGCSGIALYKSKHGEVVRFPHLSGVTIGNNVEIGANTVIVQGTLKPTVIEDDVVIGNLCNIGHGVTIKSKVWMSVGTLIGGNCVVKQNTTLGLGVSVKDNLFIDSNTSIGMGSVVTKSTEENSSYFGNPAKPLRGLKTNSIKRS